MDAWLDRYKGPILVLLIAGVVAGGGLLSMRQNATAPLLVVTPTVVLAPTAAPQIKVHVSGAVVQPGVYTFRLGDRVEDALAAAGGPTADANPNGLNLAARLSDGQQVVVPRLGEPTPPASAGAAGPHKVSINTASLAELDTLPGIGPVTGQKIIDYRTKNGPFQKLEDLRDQKIVPASTFDKIKDLITL